MYICGGDHEQFSEEDFPPHFFPAGWNVVFDKLGDGCKMTFL